MHAHILSQARTRFVMRACANTTRVHVFMNVSLQIFLMVSSSLPYGRVEKL